MFLNIWAAIDLGADIYPHEKETVAIWFYAMLGLAACSIGFAVFAVRSWRVNRKPSPPPPLPPSPSAPLSPTIEPLEPRRFL